MLLYILAACGTEDGKGDNPGGDVAVPSIVINEFVADNKSYADPDGVPTDTADPGEFDDWVELYNTGEEAVSLDGLYLTDDMGEPTKWALPAGESVEPGGFFLVWADSDPEQGEKHTNFKLSATGEELGVYYATGDGEAWVDKVTFGEMAADLSSARVPDGDMNWKAGAAPTPGASNGL
jgi:hypothetical protein